MNSIHQIHRFSKRYSIEDLRYACHGQAVPLVHICGLTTAEYSDLVFYAYSFYPNFNNTEKLLSIISYVRDEYDIFNNNSDRLQALINKYSFILEKALLNDVVDLFLFFLQGGIEIPSKTENIIVSQLADRDDPILWANYLLYSKYNEKYHLMIKSIIEDRISEHLKSILINQDAFLYREFWWIIVFNKCPLLSQKILDAIDKKIDEISSSIKDKEGLDKCATDLFLEFLKGNKKQFFNWDVSSTDFLRTFTFKTYERTIFRNYKEGISSLEWGSF